MTVTLASIINDKTFIMAFGNGNGILGLDIIYIGHNNSGVSCDIRHCGDELVKSAIQTNLKIVLSVPYYSVISLYSPEGFN